MTFKRKFLVKLKEISRDSIPANDKTFTFINLAEDCSELTLINNSKCSD